MCSGAWASSYFAIWETDSSSKIEKPEGITLTASWLYLTAPFQATILQFVHQFTIFRILTTLWPILLLHIALSSKSTSVCILLYQSLAHGFLGTGCSCRSSCRCHFDRQWYLCFWLAVQALNMSPRKDFCAPHIPDATFGPSATVPDSTDRFITDTLTMLAIIQRVQADSSSPPQSPRPHWRERYRVHPRSHQVSLSSMCFL